MLRLPPPSELRWDYFKASGPGGQHRNKSETAVRLTHLPTGIVVTASERRSRRQNRANALRRLSRRLETLGRQHKSRKRTRPSAASRRRLLEAKRRRGRLKALRRRPGGED